MFAALSFSMIGTEVYLRMTHTDRHSQFLLRIPDQKLGWRLQPNGVFKTEDSNGEFQVRYNSSGWRDIDRPLPKADGVYRIVVLGDSYMEGYSVPLADTLANQLEKLFNEAGVKTEVINLGVGGYGTLQEYLVFEEYGKFYQPDLVLLAFYPTNDLQNNMPGWKRPYLDPAQQIWTVVPVDFKRVQSAFERSQRRVEPKSYLRRFLTRRVRGLKNTKKLSKDQTPYAVDLCEEGPAYSEAWEVTERILQRLKNSVAEVDAKFVVLNVPDKAEGDLEYRKQVVSTLQEPEAFCIGEGLGHQRLANLLERLEIPFVNLLGPFVKSESVLFGDRDHHWNSRGHELAARVTFSELQRLGYLAEGRLNE